MPPYSTTSATTTTYSSGPYYTATTVSSPPLYVSFESIEEKAKQYFDKVDEHVDELEKDITFLNEKREEQENKIKYLMDTIAAAAKEIEALKSYCGYLENKLEGKE